MALIGSRGSGVRVTTIVKHKGSPRRINPKPKHILEREATLRATIYEHLKLVLHREPSRQEMDAEFRKMNGEILYIPAPISRGKYRRMEILKL